MSKNREPYLVTRHATHSSIGGEMIKLQLTGHTRIILGHSEAENVAESAALIESAPKMRHLLNCIAADSSEDGWMAAMNVWLELKKTAGL